MKMNNKGFSLVELIIVIAIMVVLGGVLAPQYMKHLASAKISTDASNADSIATAINVAIADGESTIVASPITGVGGTTTTGVSNLATLPVSKVDATYKWYIVYDASNGVSVIHLGANGSTADPIIWPTADAYKTANS